MPTKARQVLKQALALPPKARADIAGTLLRSLDAREEAGVDAAWAVEVEERVREVDSGAAGLIPWERVRRRLEARAATHRGEGRRAMKAVEITDATLADHGRRPRKDTWLLTRRGKPVAAVVPISSEADLETFGLSHNPRFIEIVNRSWASFKKGGGVSLEEMRRRHGTVRKVGRRRKAR